MKTPDEIKKGLKCCQTPVKCECCPYQQECDLPFGDLVIADALALIQQLEEKVKSFQAETREAKKWAKRFERERDAAVEQLRDAFNCCKFCKHMQSDGYVCQSKPELDRSCWEWRGPCEENECTEP